MAITFHSLRLIAITAAAFLVCSPRLVSSAGFNCYFPDGTTTTPDVPCNQSAIDAGGHSACCNEANMCLDNGLCFGGGVVSRGSCTDSQWGEDCPQYCKSNPGGGNPMYPCIPFTNTWACGFNTTDCLDNTNLFTMEGGNGFILRGSQVSQLEGGSEVALLVEATTTLTADSTNSNNASSSSSSSSSTSSTAAATSSSAPAGSTFTAGDVAGAAAGAGVPLLLALIGAIFVIFSQRKKLNKQKKEHEKALAAANERPPMQHNQQSWQNHSPAPQYASPVHQQPPYQAGSGGGYFTAADQPKVSHDFNYNTPAARQGPTDARGNFREMDTNSQIREMGADNQISEMEAAQKQGGGI